MDKYKIIESRSEHLCTYSISVSSNNIWCQKLDDSLLISEISIPGTHDSCATYGSYNCLKTQSWDLNTQLYAGIRYFDIRCQIIDNYFFVN